MEVLRHNFEDSFPVIASALSRSIFVAIDTEFSLLVDTEETSKPSLFDSGEERYRKLRHIVKTATLTQFGLSAFEDVSTLADGGTESRYVAHTFNFYLYPKAYGPIDTSFKCQSSSLEFLCQHSFDFNKFVYGGVPFLNRSQRDLLSSYLESQSSLAGLDRQLDEDCLQAICSRVAEWIVKAQELTEDAGENARLSAMTIPAEKTVGEFTIHAELRQRFPENLWTRFGENGQVIVVKVSKERRAELELGEQDELKERTLDFLTGFSRIFDLIVEEQKPVVGHNLFMDLLFLHEKFYLPLPTKLKDFKKNINRLFPSIFDTKNIIHRERRRLEDELGFNFQTTSLSELYAIFDSNKGKLGSLYSPVVDHASPGKYSAEENRIPHEAGYDSYIAGYVFLRLAHFVATRDVKATEAAPVRFAWYIHSLRSFLNHVNIIRASIDHLSLDVDKGDPPSRRPQLLVIASRTKYEPLQPAFVASSLAQFGSVDVKPLNAYSVCIAVGTLRVFKEVVEFCSKSDKLACYRYRPFRHSKTARGLLWAVVLASGCVTSWILFGK